MWLGEREIAQERGVVERSRVKNTQENRGSKLSNLSCSSVLILNLTTRKLIILSPEPEVLINFEHTSRHIPTMLKWLSASSTYSNLFRSHLTVHLERSYELRLYLTFSSSARDWETRDNNAPVRAIGSDWISRIVDLCASQKSFTSFHQVHLPLPLHAAAPECFHATFLSGVTVEKPASFAQWKLVLNMASSEHNRESIYISIDMYIYQEIYKYVCIRICNM